MKHFRFMVLALCFFLSSCGGGGSAQKDTHGIRLLASSLDLAPLSLFSDLEGVTLPQNVPFGRLSERVPLASSSYNIRLAEHYNPERVLKVVSFDAEAQGAYSLWVFGSSAQLQIQLLPDRTLELESNMSAIRFLNGTQDSSSAVLNLVGDS
ncbi:MAG: DUF4397 domain-containing protein, partial [Bdellovibrionales bacterium]|nr:DUF4397 domain-containing protein [Bdellovibrionales bacterium]